MGNHTKFAYDDKRRVASLTFVTDTANDTGPTTAFSYRPGSAAAPTSGTTTVTDANNNATTYTYDASNQAIKVVDALGHERASGYDPYANVTSLRGNETSALYDLAYDANNNLAKAQAPASAPGQTRAATSFSYATQGQAHLASSRTDAQGKCRAFAYDARGNLASTYDGLVANAAGNCDGATNTARFSQTYNPNGTVKDQTDPKGGVTAYVYDTKGNLASVTPPAPLGATIRVPDALSRTASTTDAKGQKTAFAYDGLDRITRVTYGGDVGCASRATCADYGYDANGNMVSRVDNTGTTSFAYDAMGRLSRKTFPDASTMSFAYDRVGNLTTYTDSGGSVAYGYDAANNLTSLAEPGGTCTSPVFKCTTFAYDNDNRRTLVTYPGSSKLSMAYDPAGNQKSVVGKNPQGGVLTSYSYTYTQGSADRELRQTMTDAGGRAVSYSYDAHNHLTRAQTTAGGSDDYQYGYDLNGNRTSQSVNGATTAYTYNAANQLTSGPTTPTYDANGNETRGPDGRTSAYNAKDQTTSATPPGGSALSMSYADADQTERTQAGAAAFASSPLGVASSTTAGASTHYTRDSGGNLVGQRSPDGTRRYYLFDGLGSVVGMIDTGGNLVASYAYDPYGKQTSPEPSLANPWRFAGGYLDTQTGLTKFGTRYYDPSVGRWTQQDPEAGSIGDPATMNLYTYVGSNPVNFTDPTGRKIANSVLNAMGAIGVAATVVALTASTGGTIWGVATVVAISTDVAGSAGAIACAIGSKRGQPC